MTTTNHTLTLRFSKSTKPRRSPITGLRRIAFAPPTNGPLSSPSEQVLRNQPAVHSLQR